MAVQLISTKMHPPAARRTLVARPRLLAALSDGIAHGRRVTLVSAPAGAGKTTLIRHWLASSPLPVAWVSLDEGDGDPARLLRYLVGALQTLIAGIGDGMLAALHTAHPPAPSDLLIGLLNELAATEDALALVLDDVHTITSHESMHLLGLLIDHAPPQLALILATREDPDLPLARLRASNQLTELRPADLRFTERETADFLNRVMGLHLAPDAIAALDRRIEGWAAGLQLAALSMRGKADTSTFIRTFSGTHQFVLDYLLEEVLHQQPVAVQAFLLRTSVLHRLSDQLCAALLGIETSAARDLLDTLERANLFVIPLDDERRWYRYHHLFRDLLYQRLCQTSTADALRGLHRCASDWYAQAGDTGEAFRHALAADDAPRAARLLESHWLQMDETFQTGAWLGWANQLPPDIQRVRPVLLTQMGWSYMDAGNAEASEALLDQAEARLQCPPDTHVVAEPEQFRMLPVRIAIARAYNAQVQQRYADTVRYARLAQHLAPPEDEFLQAQALAILSGAVWASGELHQALAYMGGWVDAAYRAGNMVFAIAASFGKADILVAQGRLRAAMQVYHTALHWAQEHNAAPHTAHHHLGLGMLYYEIGDDTRATAHLHRAFALGEHTTIADWAYRSYLAQAQLREDEGAYDDALRLLDAAGRAYVRTPIPDLRPVAARKARIVLKQGRREQGRAWASMCACTLDDPPDYLHEFERLTLARLILADAPGKQQFARILRCLDAHEALAEAQQRLRSQVEILLVRAATLYAQSQPAGAAAALEQALERAAPEGYARSFTEDSMLIRTLAPRIRKPLVRAFAASIGAPPAPGIAAAPADRSILPLLDPLSEREREVLRLIAQGLSNQDITRRLTVALSTVKGHNLRIFAKLHARNRTEAVARARELGLI